MNKEIITMNGIAIVEDEKGNKRQVDNCNNLTEILIQENIIEELENKKKEIEAEKIRNEISINKQKANLIVNAVYNLLLVVLVPIGIHLLFDAVDCSSIILNILGNISLNSLVTSFSFFSTLILSVPILAIEKSDIEKLENELRANENLYKYVTGELSKQKTVLEELNNNKKLVENIDDDTLRTSKINDENKMYNLNYYMDLYYQCGYDYNRYLKYYNNGKLREKLKKDFTEEEIEIYENYYKVNEEIERAKVLALTNKK